MEDEVATTKLQTLINGGCISAVGVNSLSTTQLAAIDAMLWSQIYAFVEVRQSVGMLSTGGMI